MSQDLCKKIAYTFNQPQWLQLALTHRSFAAENNERLEFLGDAIVGTIVAEKLLQQFPTATEGDLTRFRASLVNRETLGKLAQHFDLGQYLRFGSSEKKTGAGRISILSCALEALIGAIYLDSDFLRTREVVLGWYQPLFAALTDPRSHKDPKTQLQEYLQAKHASLPSYTITEMSGKSHQQMFTVTCTVGAHKVTATGSSRRHAEQAAASKMLEKVKI